MSWLVVLNQMGRRKPRAVRLALGLAHAVSLPLASMRPWEQTSILPHDPTARAGTASTGLDRAGEIRTWPTAGEAAEKTALRMRPVAALQDMVAEQRRHAVRVDLVAVLLLLVLVTLWWKL